MKPARTAVFGILLLHLISIQSCGITRPYALQVSPEDLARAKAEEPVFARPPADHEAIIRQFLAKTSPDVASLSDLRISPPEPSFFYRRSWNHAQELPGAPVHRPANWEIGHLAPRGAAERVWAWRCEVGLPGTPYARWSSSEAGPCVATAHYFIEDRKVSLVEFPTSYTGIELEGLAHVEVERSPWRIRLQRLDHPAGCTFGPGWVPPGRYRVRFEATHLGTGVLDTVRVRGAVGTLEVTLEAGAAYLADPTDAVGQYRPEVRRLP